MRDPQPVLGLSALACCLASLVAAPGIEGVSGAFLGLLMLAIAANDARHFLIPNELSGTAFALALLRAGALAADGGVRAVVTALLWAGFRAAAVALPLLALMLLYRRFRGRDGLGLGDVKLAAVCGAWLDFTTVVVVIELAALSAIAVYVIHAVVSRRTLRAMALLPFGLFLAPAIWIGWIGETWLSNWLESWPG